MAGNLSNGGEKVEGGEGGGRGEGENGKETTTKCSMLSVEIQKLIF